LLPITFQLLRFRQRSGLNSTRIKLACQGFLRTETKLPMFLVQHRGVRLRNLLACVSDGTSLLNCKRSVLERRDRSLIDWPANYTHANLFVKVFTKNCLFSLAQPISRTLDEGVLYAFRSICQGIPAFVRHFRQRNR